MTERMSADDWGEFEKRASAMLDALDEYEAKRRHAPYKPMGKRKRRSAARLKVKR